MQDPKYYKYTRIIILVNIAVYILIKILLGIFNPETLASIFFLTPSNFIKGIDVWTIFTSLFVHIFLLVHLLPNMFSLYFIGKFVEPLIGRRRFLFIFLASGIFASLIHILYSIITQTHLDVPSMGASGAIMGLIGVMAAMIPKSKVLLFFFIPIPLWFLGILLVGLVLTNPQVNGMTIGHVAHLAGFIGGYLYGLYLINKFPERTKMIRRIYS